jgi:hypothetical protein
MARPSGSVKKWVRLGAWTRLAEMDVERAEIFKAFPDFKRGAPAASRARPKRRISAKGRAAMKAGMKKYWARRKAAEKK